ncbi:DEKNAAC103012 [Brettanomyces naardenensis]|uniref:Mannan endo-1,6-alpha-mannosidase n=1 Tax=Brettanomyces naardenensis TaxID=13370 RepID=A0A448YM89_BRENA|nr:DEKNAAC103012 [Brettanomyces naardenensis]
MFSLFALLSLLYGASSLSLEVGNKQSVCDAATLITDGIMDYYEGTRYGGAVGMFQPPYYWWEAGEVFGGMIDTWYFCQNDTYQQIIYDALMAQRGTGNAYMPMNQSLTEGNDDQGFWAFAAMTAAERNFTNPPSKEPGWLALTQGAYNTMWQRWDSGSCEGGLRWQIFTWNSGYDYKNTISNACLFNIAARLARYTKNDTYADTASTVYKWLTTIDFMQLNGDSYSIHDGAQIENNCTVINGAEWSYNYGVLLGGAAFMYNYTGEQSWETEVGRILSGMSIFLNDDVLFEQQCQSSNTCNNDQRSFRSIVSQMLGATAKLVPSYTDQIMNILEASANGAAASCSGGSDGHTCGIDWSKGSWDGMYGLGEQISALEVIQNTLVLTMPGPVDNSTGSSQGNPNEGIGFDETSNPHQITVTQKDKAAAGIVTFIVLVIALALGAWMIV